ncbi:MAG: hypothetical protein JW793_15280 [Acidobacteria bacterium]|nr:hypothetical protein [Acidobacteriota bacterium]
MSKSAKTLTVPSGILSAMDRICLWIRTGSGPQIGFGHLRRTMVLARFLNDCCLPLFLVDPADSWSRKQLADQGAAFVCERLASVWSHLPEPKAILLDTRETEGLFDFVGEAKKRHLTVFSIHDLGLNPLPSDIAIDGSIAPDISGFPNPRTVFYTGPDYMVLDPVYRLLHPKGKCIGDRMRTVFVNLGGGNSGSFYRKILDGLALWNRGIEVLAVAGFSGWENESFSRKNRPSLNVQWISEHIGAHCFRADLAITAGGIAAYEALCTGTPLMALSYDRYQDATIRALADAGACAHLGPGENLSASDLPGILERFESDHVGRRTFSLNGRKIVDGRGVERVAGIFRKSMGARANGSLMEDAG